MTPSPFPILVVAGEPSGDWLAAQVVRSLRVREPRLFFFGIGGDHLQSEGCVCLQHNRNLAVMGLSEVLRRLPFFYRLLQQTVAEAEKRRPIGALLVDYPGFNLRLARQLARRQIPVFFYVVPQVWAWHKSRARILAQTGKQVLSLFPFEPPLLAPLGVKADYVGHPLADVFRQLRNQPPDLLPWPEGTPRLALLPGSRPSEIKRHLPVMLEAAALLENTLPRLTCLIACPTPADVPPLNSALTSWRGHRPSRLSVIGGQTRAVLLQATAAAVASGTVTLEAALARCPMVIGYRLSPLSYWAANLLVHVPHVGLVNLIAGRRLCPELIQHQFQPTALCDALKPLLLETAERNDMIEGLENVIRRMDFPRAADVAAEHILKQLHPPPA